MSKKRFYYNNPKILTFCVCATDTESIREAFNGVTNLNIKKKN
jgi:hypothetical protein